MAQNSWHAREPGSRRTPLAALGLLAALGPSTVDLYLPALPAIRAEMTASTSAVQATLTATTIGFALGQFVVGNWSDTVGRRRPLLITLALHIVGSIGVAVAPSIAWVLAFRFLQGIGAAGSAVISTATVRDLYSGSSFIRALSRLALIGGLAPVVAPILGSQLLNWFGWRGLFVTVGGFGALCMAAAAGLLAETLPESRRLSQRPSQIANRYVVLVRNRAFVAAALLGGLLVSGVYAQMTASSILLQTTYGLSAAQYSLAFAANAVSFVAGTQAAARVVRKVPAERILALGLPVQLLAAVSIVPASSVGAIGVTAATAIFMIGAGLSVPCLQVLGMAEQGHQAGTAAAFLGAVNFGLGGLTAPLVGAFGTDLRVSMSVVMVGTQILAIVVLGVLLLGRRRGTAASQPEPEPS